MRKVTALFLWFLFASASVATPGTGHAQTAANAGKSETAQASPATAVPRKPPKTTATTPTIRSDEELMILQVRLGRFILSDGLEAYLNDGSLLLPFGEYTRMLEFPITVSPESGRAGGWFLKENRLFSLDLYANQVIVDGVKEDLDPALVELHPDEIYVDVRVLAEWLPVDIDYDLPNLMLNLTSREPLPIEQRIAREDYRAKHLKRAKAEEPDYPEIEVPYRFIDLPFVDTNVEFTFQSDENDQTKRNARYNTFVAGNLAMMDAALFLSGDDQDRLSQARLTLSRKDPDGRLFGPLGASEFSVGDIYTPQVSLVSRTQLGRGFTVSNIPINQLTEFDRITLNGDLPVGWELELYRNEVLLDFRVARLDGRYVFEDVPLLFGVNILRLVFYGPQGQSREEIRQIRVGPGQIKPGEHNFRMSANQQDLQLLLGEVETVGANTFQGEGRYFAEYSTGITRNFSLAANISSLPLEGGHRVYAGLSGRAALGNVFGRLDVVRDLSQGWATKAAVQTSVKGVNIIAEHNQLFRFQSEQFTSTSDPIDRTTDLRLDGAFRLANLPHVPFSLTVNHERRDSGNTTTSLINRLSSAIGRTNFSNTLRWNLTESGDVETTTLSGTALIGGSVGEVRLRGQLSYDVTPINVFTNTGITADWRINKTFNGRVSFNSDLKDDGITTYSAGLNSRLEHVNLGMDVDYSDNDELNGRLTMAFALGRDPRGGLPKVRPDSIAGKGGVSARVFLDNNQNGTFDEGDTPLEGVKFKAGRRQLPVATDEHGIAFNTGLAVHKRIPFTVAGVTLEDPFWIPQQDGHAIVLRPGVTVEIEIPIVATGEIDGVIYRRKGDWAGEVSEAIVQLVDGTGAVVQETKSAYDGFYLLERVRPGMYQVRIDPEQLTRLNMSSPTPREVLIESDGTVVNGIDFILDTNGRVQAFRAKLATFLSQTAADDNWKAAAAKLASTLKGLNHAIESVESGTAQGMVFNLYVGPFKARDAAETFCLKVREAMGSDWCNPLKVEAQ